LIKAILQLIKKNELENSTTGWSDVHSQSVRKINSAKYACALSEVTTGAYASYVQFSANEKKLTLRLNRRKITPQLRTVGTIIFLHISGDSIQELQNL